jgi:hypothetical protein
MYKIKSWLPSRRPNGAAFFIVLTDKFRKAVEKSKLTQENMDALIVNLGNAILSSLGYPEVDKNMLLCELRVKWGEYGPEHISVPGNACGLDIDTHFVGQLPGEVALMPHNIDTVSQASMLLSIFIYIAEVLETVDE